MRERLFSNIRTALTFYLYTLPKHKTPAAFYGRGEPSLSFFPVCFGARLNYKEIPKIQNGCPTESSGTAILIACYTDFLGLNV